MDITPSIKQLADDFYRRTTENNEVYFVKWSFPDNTLPDISLEKAEQDYQLAQKTLKTVHGLLSQPQSHTDEMILLLLEYYCHYIEKNYLNYWHKFDLNHYTCPLPDLYRKILGMNVQAPKEKERFLDIFRKFPDYIRAMHRKLVEQSKHYIRMPVAACEIVLTTIDSYLEMNEEAGTRCDGAVPIAEEAAQVFAELVDYLKTEYIPHAPQTLGMGQYPGGYEMYRRQMDTYISCDATPEEVHAAGFRALEETKSKMRDIMKQVGFTGTLEEFTRSVQDDPRFKFKTPEEMQETLTGYLNQIRPILPKYFNRMPKADCAVRRIDPKREATTSWGYYNVPVEEPIGVYYYSAAELDKRCQVRANAVIYHELLPGHHYQMNLVMEDDTLPDIIHHHYNTACADGWAEYASGFCREIGLYSPYNDFGRLCWDAFLCCRLIVDTGLNALGWTYEQAEAFLLEHTMFTQAEVYTELLRYTVGFPAQALSYKWGSMKFFGFREKAEKELGEKFDIKEFHDVMLEYGSIPLNLVEHHFNWWLENAKRK
ncbi:MAG: DUF885 domain-containing protein [Oscillospiraceae bacterium]|nr:DUF885 domain-containing protein [Oscillospiraceae bacterium]